MQHRLPVFVNISLDALLLPGITCQASTPTAMGRAGEGHWNVSKRSPPNGKAFSVETNKVRLYTGQIDHPMKAKHLQPHGPCAAKLTRGPLDTLHFGTDETIVRRSAWPCISAGLRWSFSRDRNCAQLRASECAWWIGEVIQRNAFRLCLAPHATRRESHS